MKCSSPSKNPYAVTSFALNASESANDPLKIEGYFSYKSSIDFLF